MASFPDEEAIAKALMSGLSTNMATQLLNIDTEKADLVPTPVPKLYYLAEQQEIPEYSSASPVCTILLEDAGSESSTPQFIGGTRDIVLTAVITLGYINGTETTLQTWCYRASRALSKILWTSNLNGIGALGAKTFDEQRRRSPMTNKGGNFEKLTQHTFKIRYTEAF